MQKLTINESRLLVFGGPYGNLAATRQLRERARFLGLAPSQVICSGDLVAYCGDPVETLELVRDWGIPVVMGNCEESLANDEADCGCGFAPNSHCSLLAVTWYRYAAARINLDHRRWMAALPRAIDVEFAGRSLRFVHGSLDSINQFVFPSTPREDKQAQLERAGVDILVGGHSGIPFGQRIGDRWWLNAGVIGMPANDGGQHVWYMLLEARDDALEVSWHRLEYDYEASYRSTLAAGMAEYAQALRDGLWPSMDILPQAERRQRGQALEPAMLTMPGSCARRALESAV